MAKTFRDLRGRNSGQAITLEEEDRRIYADFADGLRETYPATAATFDDMQREESEHHARLVDTYRERFGNHIPLTLAPIFAAAFATHSTHDTFLIGLAASVGAGISTGFAEALSDDGSLTSRGRPWIRGSASGLMTAAGGIGHTIPFLLHNFNPALAVAMAVVAAELVTISYVRHPFMDTSLVAATIQVVVGGALVLLAGLLIGSA